MSAYRTAMLVASLLMTAAALDARAAAADDCAPIVKAELASVTAPAFRQYLSLPGGGAGKDKRLMSIALGDAVYMATGGPGGWQKMDRKEIIGMAKEAAADASYRDCKSLGSEPVGGVATAVYAFAMESKSQGFPTSHGKVWIADDGLLRKQATDQGSLRYEYDDVKAPIP